MPTLPALLGPRQGAGRRTAPRLELVILRRSLGARAERHAHCAHCRRVPLVGEEVHVYTGPAGERVVCALCRHLRKEPPARSELVHSPEHERAVRVMGRRAA